MKILWLAVTCDKYELPVAVTETLAELSRAIGVSPASICHSMSRADKYGVKNKRKYRFYKIEVGEENETD